MKNSKGKCLLNFSKLLLRSSVVLKVFLLQSPMLTKKKIIKNHKLKILKIQNSGFVRTTETKIQKKVCKASKVI